MADRALIFGISGQDGAYLARHLLRRSYKVYGTSRDKEMSKFVNLARLGILDQVELLSASPHDFRSVFQVISDVEPHEIYDLAGQSSVGLSFAQPVETLDSTIIGPLNILECMRLTKNRARLYSACSSECFGNVVGPPADESTPFRPRSPYGVGKAAAFWMVANYREAYGLFAVSGILFNHESPLRPRRFVTQKIIVGAAEIAEGKADQLTLGDLTGQRDYGWAPEYVEAMALILQADEPRDYVICTGTSVSLEAFVEEAFAWFGLDWRAHVKSDASLRRPMDIARSAGSPAKVKQALGWQAKKLMRQVVAGMAEAELRRRKGESDL